MVHLRWSSILALALTACGDAKAPDVGECVADLGRSGSFETYRFSSERLDVWMVREAVGPGTGQSTIFELRSLAFAMDGECTSFAEDAGTTLEYENSHHNWRDVATAETGDTRFVFEMTYDLESAEPRWKLTASATEPTSGATILEPTALTPTGGPVCTGCLTRLPVHLNEVMIEPSDVYVDDRGEQEPWVELWNWSAEDVDLSGYRLGRTPRDPEAWSFPEGTLLPRHAYLVVPMDGQPEQGPLHPGLRLTAAEPRLSLTAPSGISPGERDFTSTDASKSRSYSQFEGYPEEQPTPGSDNPGLR